MNRRKFLVGLAAATAAGPSAAQSAEYFPWVGRFPTPEMVEAVTIVGDSHFGYMMNMASYSPERIRKIFGGDIMSGNHDRQRR